MNRNRKLIIPSVLGVLILLMVGLFQTMPARAVTLGTLEILDTADGAIGFARQGGTIRLRITDPDLNVPIKRAIRTAGSFDVNALTGTVTTNGTTTLTSNAQNFDTLAVDDTILVRGEKVRKITAIDTVASPDTLTVSEAFETSAGGLNAWQVDTTATAVPLASFDNCPDCAEGFTITSAPGDASTVFDIADLFSLADSGTGAGTTLDPSFTNRFSGGPDAAINKLDVDVRQSDDSPLPTGVTFTVDVSNGQLTINNDPTSGADPDLTNLQVLYWAGSANTTGSTVKLTSTADPTGITVSLKETGNNTGVFKTCVAGTGSCAAAGDPDISLIATGPTYANPRELKVSLGDTLTVTYTDLTGGSTVTVTKSITVETTTPEFANLIPAHNDATTSSLPIVSGDITDSGSGIVQATIEVMFNVGTVISTTDPNIGVTGTIAAITGGFHVTQRNITVIPDGPILWWILGNDVAGNASASDQVPPFALTGSVDTAGTTALAATGGAGTLFLTELTVGDTVEVTVLVGTDEITEVRTVTAIATDISLTVDTAFTTTGTAIAGSARGSVCNRALFDVILAPTAANSAGCQPFIVNVDNTAPMVEFGTGNTRTGDYWDATADELKSGVAALNDRVRVQFDEDLDGTTVDRTDFTVVGIVPTLAEWFSDSPNNVFLTTGSMAPNSAPEVKLIGQVKDKAGNAVSTATGNAVDGIPATLTVTVTGTGSPVTTDKIKIRVTSDEDLTLPPTLQVKKVGVNSTLPGANLALPLVSVATRTWEREFSITAGVGQFNVFVSGMDVGGGISTLVGDASVPTATGAVLFEVDTAVEAPSLRPTGLTSDDPNTFITLDFRNEGKEYGLTAACTTAQVATGSGHSCEGKTIGDKVVTIVPAEVDTNHDTHGTVTITSATLDGAAITFNTRDNTIYSVRPGSLSVGDHTLDVAVTDEAGNSSILATLTITITTPALYAIPLDPGMNLVSLPAPPRAGATGVNDVFSDTNIEGVSTYDPFTVGGPWLSATRNPATGLLEGNLTTVGANTAYWVQSASFVDLTVDIPKANLMAVPGTISLISGWNLVPVVDIAGSAFGSVKASYFTGLGPASVLTWRTDTTKWIKIVESTTTEAGDTDGVLDADDDGLDNDVLVGRGYWVNVAAAGQLVP